MSASDGGDGPEGDIDPETRVRKGHVQRMVQNSNFVAGPKIPFGAVPTPFSQAAAKHGAPPPLKPKSRPPSDATAETHDADTHADADTPPPAADTPADTAAANGAAVQVEFEADPTTPKPVPPVPPAPTKPTAPGTPARPAASASFIAKPGVPRNTRVITASRAEQMYGTMGNTPNLTSFSKRETMAGDTLTVFLPHYQHFVREFGNINRLGLNPSKLEQAINLLKTHQGILNHGLLDRLDQIQPGLSESLYQIMLAQFAEGQSGIIRNIVSFSDSPLIARLNDFGFGTHLQAQMLQVLENSEFFSSIDLDIKDKDFKLDHTDPSGQVTTLVKGHVDEAANQVSFKIDPKVPPQLRDLAIKHLVMMVATHTQQNNSNAFNIGFGDNPYENLRILQLAIGAYNLHVPRHLIDAYISKLPGYVSAEVRAEFVYWANHSEVFIARIAENGSKIINEDMRPPNTNGYGKQSMAKIQAEMLEHVTEDIFPAPPAPAAPAVPPTP